MSKNLGSFPATCLPGVKTLRKTPSLKMETGVSTPPFPPDLPAAGMLIEMWPIDRPIPYPKNARKWSERAIATVAASIKEYGFRQPIVVDAEGVIVIGHLRLAAAKSLHLTEVPVHVARDLTPLQIKGLRIADNRTSEEASWDYELLNPELLDLKALDFDLSLTGFDSMQLAAMLEGTAEDAAAAPGESEPPPAANSPVIAYNIVFTTKEEQAAWFAFLRALKLIYPEATIAERLTWYIEKHGPQK